MIASATHDYTIVGAGSAGCVLANRLSADARVLLDHANHSQRQYQRSRDYDWRTRSRFDQTQ
jgi:choline dehydrogenase-like flavoprotein